MTTQITSPVQLHGRFDPHLSRWLWLVKMVLAIPHFVILAVLNAAFIVVTLASGIVILFTGRYPRSLFDFTVGVLRWNWRVGFYVYAALGTDSYPPFTLRDTDYPAHFDVAYPARLSRGLVVVKWMLALPHVAIVIFVMADILTFVSSSTGSTTGAFSIVNVLAVVAGAFLLMTGRYPQPLFDLLIGINRWIYRVVAYVAFMSDVYPPFRLDTGANEPRTAAAERDAEAILPS